MTAIDITPYIKAKMADTGVSAELIAEIAADICAAVNTAERKPKLLEVESGVDDDGRPVYIVYFNDMLYYDFG